jgi:hypothetical protein
VLHLQLQIGAEDHPGLIEHLIAAAHAAGTNQLLGLLTTRRQTTVQQQQIQPLAFCHGFKAKNGTNSKEMGAGEAITGK